MGGRLVGVWISGLALGCGFASAFECESDGECDASGQPGVCEPNGFCSFPDSDCASGRRYGALAGMGLAGECVPEDAGSTGGVSSPSTSEASSASTSLTSESTTGPSGSTSGVGVTSDSSSDGTGPLDCPGGTADCDGDPSNGCEAQLDQPATCGDCDTQCAEDPPAIALCVEAQCALRIDIEATDDTYIRSALPDDNFGSELELRCDDEPPFDDRSLVRAPELLQLIDADAEILEATMGLTCNGSGDPVDLYVIMESWEESTVTFNTAPSTSPAPVTTFPASVGQIEVDVTPLVSGWVEGQFNFGVLLRSTGSDTSTYHSSEVAVAADRPLFRVLYRLP